MIKTKGIKKDGKLDRRTTFAKIIYHWKNMCKDREELEQELRDSCLFTKSNLIGLLKTIE